MTVSNVSNGASHVFDPQTDFAGGSISDMAAEVAVLMVETQENQKQSDRVQLSAARAEFSEALRDQVAELKSAADAVVRGAMLQAGLSTAGAGLELWGAGRADVENPWQGKAGKGLGDLAEPLGRFAGKSYGEANAKSAEGAQTTAKWQLDDAKKAIDNADTKQGKALDWLGSMLDQDAATMTAILSNKV